MRIRHLLSALLLFMLTGGGIFAADMTRAQLQEMYLNFFKERGIDAKIDEEGDVAFVSQFQNFNLTYWVGVYEDDPEFFQIFSTNLWDPESPQELNDMRRAANYATSRIWLSKVILNSRNDDIFIAAETVLTKPQDFANVFDMMFECLNEAFQVFINEMPK